MNEFWTLIEKARAEASDGAWPSGSAIGAALVDGLVRLPPGRIVEFHHRYLRTASRAHQWRMRAAAHLIWDRSSDEAFGDFKAGLIGLGEDAFEDAVADPDALAHHPMVRAIADGRVDRFALAGEAIDLAASRAYERRTDDADGFWKALEEQPADADGDRPESGESWSGRFGGPDDVTRIPLRLPRLHALFASPEADRR